MTTTDVLMKRQNLVIIYYVTEHILPSNSAEEGLSNQFIFKKPYIFQYFKYIHSVYPSG